MLLNFFNSRNNLSGRCCYFLLLQMNKLKQKDVNNLPVGLWFQVLLYIHDYGGGCGLGMGETKIAEVQGEGSR